MGTGGPLIGREVELTQLEATLSSSRLVTVSGPPGCGKSRLALELLKRLRSAAAGPEAALVELASIVNAEQLIDALLRAVGARERFGIRPTQVLLDSIAGRRLLLVLDNCEHLATAVGRVSAELLNAPSGVQLLATSREPLAITHESVYRLGPLSVPDGVSVSAVVRSDAGRLFVDRAACSNPAFALTPSVARAISRICHQLDGLPLPLTLAAARLDAISAGEVAEALSRRNRLSEGAGEAELPHHRSLRASLDWSYHLLGAEERSLLRRVSIFSGGFTTSSAAAVATDGWNETVVHMMLGDLEAKGLLMSVPARSAPRWTFLRTVVGFAAEQLVAEDEHEITADRHLQWFRAYAAQADALLLQPDGCELIDEERPNVRRALDRAMERDQHAALGIVASLMRHWLLAERFEEAGAAGAAVLSLGADQGDPAARAIVHCGSGLIALLSEDYGGAIANTRSGLELAASLEDAAAQSQCLVMSSMVLIQTGIDLAEGFAKAERALELQRCLSDPVGLAYSLVNVAVCAAVCDKFDVARAAYEEFVLLPEGSDHVRLRTWAETAAAWTEVVVGSPDRALAHADRALALEGDWPSMTYFQLLGFRVQALARLGRVDEALEEGERAMRRAGESGALQAIPALELALMVAQFMHGDLDEASVRAHRLLEVPQLHTQALAFEMLGRIALTCGDAGKADAHAQELIALSERSRSSRHRAIGEFLAGRAALLAGDADDGRRRMHAALAAFAQLGLEREAVDVLDELALLSADAGEGVRAARLASVASATRARLRCAPMPAAEERMAAVQVRVSEHQGEFVWRSGWAEGGELSLAEAIAYARRGRGRRDRPPAGWASLTPAELEVAQLAASGISNPQIASQLFIARSTVKMHLSSVYAKLRVANRTELATATATHASEPSTPPLSDGQATEDGKRRHELTGAERLP
jgi:predicted ATPase/DNA-binding CsgD family transcriptional regulator